MPIEGDIYSALTEIFREVLQRDDLLLTPGLTAKDVHGWDSFKQIEIIVAAEQHFGIRVSAREIDRLQNVGDLVRTIKGKLQ